MLLDNRGFYGSTTMAECLRRDPGKVLPDRLKICCQHGCSWAPFHSQESLIPVASFINFIDICAPEDVEAFKMLDNRRGSAHSDQTLSIHCCFDRLVCTHVTNACAAKQRKHNAFVGAAKLPCW